jgi:hypothetical protein
MGGKTEKFLKLELELKVYSKMMADASQVIIDKEVSSYPIFVAHQQELELGIQLADREKVAGNWNIHASSLEEFVAKQIIFEDKVKEFKKNYKDPLQHICVFVLSELGAQFIYLPKPQ